MLIAFNLYKHTYVNKRAENYLKKNLFRINKLIMFNILAAPSVAIPIEKKPAAVILILSLVNSRAC